MNSLKKLLKSNDNIILYLPESFEWLILRSGILDDREIREVLNAPQEYIESETYFSWERYFTALLVEKTNDTYLKYTKKKLNPVYLQNGAKDKICKQIELESGYQISLVE